MQPQRRRVERGVAGLPCALCGSADVVAVESRPVPRGVARLVPVPREAVRTYDLCRACGAKHTTVNGRRV